MSEWVEFKKSFTQKQEDALWQYFIDHSRVQPTGYLGVLFYVKDVDDFWRRVYARANGDFMRYHKEDKEHRQLKYEHLMQELRAFRHRGNHISRRCTHIDEHGTLWERFMLRLYRRTRDNLF